MYVTVHHGDGHPKIFSGEEKLLLEGDGVISGQLYHSELRRLRWRLFVPVERRLPWMRLGQLLHSLVGFLVELDLEAERLGYGMVRDVVVSGTSSSVRKLSAIKRGGGSFLTLARFHHCGNEAASALSIHGGALRSNKSSLNLRGLIGLSISPCYHKVVFVAHSTDCLDDLAFIVLDDLDSFELLDDRVVKN